MAPVPTPPSQKHPASVTIRRRNRNVAPSRRHTASGSQNNFGTIVTRANRHHEKVRKQARGKVTNGRYHFSEAQVDFSDVAMYQLGEVELPPRSRKRKPSSTRFPTKMQSTPWDVKTPWYLHKPSTAPTIQRTRPVSRRSARKQKPAKLSHTWAHAERPSEKIEKKILEKPSPPTSSCLRPLRLVPDEFVQVLSVTHQELGIRKAFAFSASDIQSSYKNQVLKLVEDNEGSILNAIRRLEHIFPAWKSMPLDVNSLLEIYDGREEELLSTLKFGIRKAEARGPAWNNSHHRPAWNLDLEVSELGSG